MITDGADNKALFCIYTIIFNKETKMIKETNIRIENVNYKLKSSSYRAMFLFEEITDKSIAELTSLKDQLIYIYCILKVSNPINFIYTLEDFIDVLESGEGEGILAQFAKLTEEKK